MADILSDISQDPDITLHLLGNYIGSAYSPQVEVTETDTGHEVAITYDDATDGITTKTFSVEDGDDYVLTTDDRNAIAGIVEDDLDPYVEAMQQATAAANTAADNANAAKAAEGASGGASVDLTGYLKSADAEATYAPKSHKHAMADVTGLQAALDAKASTGTATTDAAGLMSAADKAKLDGIDATKLAAKATTLGGYGITDAYTQAQADAAIASAIDSKLAALDATASAY